MVRRITNAEVNTAGGLPPAGWHLVEVTSCREVTSQRGEAYYALYLADAATRADVVRDNIMLEGKGLPYGLRKLEVLGGARRSESDGSWEIDEPETLVGRRVQVCVRHDEYEWNGDRRIGVKVDATQGTKGYREAPQGAGDGVPF